MLSLVVSVFAALVLAAPASQAPSSEEARVEQLASTPVLGAARLPKGLRPVHASSIEIPTVGRVLRLEGSFEYKGQVISFETRRQGELDDDGLVAVDVCFRDSAGRPIRYSGGGPLFPDCVVDISTNINYSIVWRAIRALARAEFNQAFASEHRALSGISADDPEKVAYHRLLRMLKRLENGQFPFGKNANSNGREVLSSLPASDPPCPLDACYYHLIFVFTGQAYKLPGHFTHSATIAFHGRRRYNERTKKFYIGWVYAWDDPNWGRAWNDPTMRANCFWLNERPDRFSQVVQNVCNTPYRLMSIHGGHNCNDRAALQVCSVQKNRMLPNGLGTSPCDDESMHLSFRGCTAYTF